MLIFLVSFELCMIGKPLVTLITRVQANVHMNVFNVSPQTFLPFEHFGANAARYHLIVTGRVRVLKVVLEIPFEDSLEFRA